MIRVAAIAVDKRGDRDRTLEEVHHCIYTGSLCFGDYVGDDTIVAVVGLYAPGCAAQSPSKPHTLRADPAVLIKVS